MEKIIFPKRIKEELTKEITEKVLKKLENTRLDSHDLGYIVNHVQQSIDVKYPKLDNEGIVSGILKHVVKTESDQQQKFNNAKILNSQVRTDFINEIVSKIKLPKDGDKGKDGKSGKHGKDGKNYTLTDQDRIDIADSVDMKGLMTEDFFNIRNAQLIKDLQSNKIRLPARSGASGPEVIKKIDKALGNSDWQNGLPSMGEIGANLPWIDLNEDFAGVVPTGEGVINWNPDELALNVQTGIGPVLQVGQELYILIANTTGSQIDNFTALRPFGATVIPRTFMGDIVVPTVQLAKADTFSTMEGTLMVSTMDIPDGEVGLATRFGRVRDADTSAFSPGDGLFVSATVAGEFTNVAPAFPNYPISMGGVIKVGTTDGEFIVSITRDIFDTIINFWNGIFRETISFNVSSNGTVVTGSLSPEGSHPDLTMMFSDGFSTLDTTPPKTITLTSGTDSNPQLNFIYVPKSTKVLTLSTVNWPVAEHIKVATVFLRSASSTQSNGALKNHNWNDHIEDTATFQGHLSDITEKLRKFEAQWDNGVEGSASGFPSDVFVSVTAGEIYQIHKFPFAALSMPTDDIHIANNFAMPFVTTTNLNNQTLDALGNTLANSSFSFVVWAVQNHIGEVSHLMCNLPAGNYAKNSPADAVTDAFNLSVYDIPNEFQGVAILIARFTFVLQADGTTWSLFDTEDLRGKLPNTTAGGGAGGGGVTTILGLIDTPSSFTGFKGSALTVNENELGMEFVILKTGTLASPPTGLFVGEMWHDTTDSSNHPIVRIAKVAT